MKRFPTAADDGGLAFGGSRMEHITDVHGNRALDNVTYPGMSLRDYFAAKSLASAERCLDYRGGAWDYDDLATEAYELADAMLRARVAQSPAEKQAAHLAEFGK